MPNTFVRAEVEEQVKADATAVLATFGLTLPEACRLMLIRIAEDKTLPFEPLIPNAETVEAMQAVERGEVTTAGSIDELFEMLNAND